MYRASMYRASMYRGPGSQKRSWKVLFYMIWSGILLAAPNHTFSERSGAPTVD
jgi:hypothetical protein